MHGLWPVGTCRSVRRHTPPPSSQPLKAARDRRGENSWSGGTARRKCCLAGDLEPDDLAIFFGDRLPPNRPQGAFFKTTTRRRSCGRTFFAQPTRRARPSLACTYRVHCPLLRPEAMQHMEGDAACGPARRRQAAGRPCLLSDVRSDWSARSHAAHGVWSCWLTLSKRPPPVPAPGLGVDVC